MFNVIKFHSNPWCIPIHILHSMHYVYLHLRINFVKFLKLSFYQLTMFIASSLLEALEKAKEHQIKLDFSFRSFRFGHSSSAFSFIFFSFLILSIMSMIVKSFYFNDFGFFFEINVMRLRCVKD